MDSRIHGYITDRKNEIIDLLGEMVAIESVRGEPCKDSPYGKKCAEMLEFTQRLYRDNGFSTELYQNDGYLLSHYGNKEETIGLFAHGDVVPVYDDWIFTKPFKMLRKDGTLIGRGTSDDKSGIIISLYVAKLIKELNIPLRHGLVMFTGVNEETGMADIKRYAESQKLPKYSFVLDTAFPCFNGDKAAIRFYAESRKQFKDIIEISGGEAFNIVLGTATAKIKYSSALFSELSGLKSDVFSAEYKDDIITVTAEGVSAHAALPEGSINAAYILFSNLIKCHSLNDEDKKQLGFLSSVLSSYDGEKFGIKGSDELFGALTCVNGIIKTENGKISLSFDVRCGTNISEEEIRSAVTKHLDAAGFDYKPVSFLPAFYIDSNHPFVKSAIKAYNEFMGTDDAKAAINAGGTYAKYLPLALETGTQVWHEPTFAIPQGHGSVHQPDEWISADGLLEAIELTALYVIEADKL